MQIKRGDEENSVSFVFLSKLIILSENDRQLHSKLKYYIVKFVYKSN